MEKVINLRGKLLIVNNEGDVDITIIEPDGKTKSLIVELENADFDERNIEVSIRCKEF